MVCMLCLQSGRSGDEPSGLRLGATRVLAHHPLADYTRGATLLIAAATGRGTVLTPDRPAIPLLAVKYAIPAVRAAVVARTRPDGRLDTAAKLTVVAAPAGAGKPVW
jgi:hypothetical protein